MLFAHFRQGAPKGLDGRLEALEQGGPQEPYQGAIGRFGSAGDQKALGLVAGHAQQGVSASRHENLLQTLEKSRKQQLQVVANGKGEGPGEADRDLPAVRGADQVTGVMFLHETARALDRSGVDDREKEVGIQVERVFPHRLLEDRTDRTDAEPAQAGILPQEEAQDMVEVP